MARRVRSAIMLAPFGVAGALVAAVAAGHGLGPAPPVAGPLLVAALGFFALWAGLSGPDGTPADPSLRK